MAHQLTFLAMLLHALLSLSPIQLTAQQWIAEQYSYDSLENIVYGVDTNFYGQAETLLLDLKIPRCTEGSFGNQPLVVCIHGGAFLEGSKEDPSIQDMCRRFAKRGYVAASINYRLGFVGDDQSWTCNFPNYACLFAGDSAEWVRAAYRALQDAKGAIRYLTNRSAEYGIDRNNVFLVGESAGAITALGAALLDVPEEKPAEAGALNELPPPAPGSLSCSYYQGIPINNNPIARPDLGSIEGDIESGNSQYHIRAVGNFYGAMTTDLLHLHPTNQSLPAIYSFHQPCDLVVPIDSGKVFWGLSWCLTNGFNCYAIANNEKTLYGSRSFSQWNDIFNYGYEIENHFTSSAFPFNYLIGQGSCADQINNPCHAYDDRNMRLNELVNFFSSHIAGAEYCLPTELKEQEFGTESLSLFPIPATDILHIEMKKELQHSLQSIGIYSPCLQSVQYPTIDPTMHTISLRDFPPGLYLAILTFENGRQHIVKLPVAGN